MSNAKTRRASAAAERLPETGPAADAVEVRVLDAALEQFRLLGIQRSSLEDIARRAGVGRVTLYRRFGSKDALVRVVLLREVQRSVAELEAVIAAESKLEAQVEAAMVFILRQCREHPLLSRLLAVEPDRVLRFLTVEGAPSLSLGCSYIRQLIRQAQEQGRIARYDPAPVAELLARLAHSLLLTPTGGLVLDNDEAVSVFARATVLPMIRDGIAPAASPSQTSPEQTA